jgi:hypothetical protein
MVGYASTTVGEDYGKGLKLLGNYGQIDPVKGRG